MANTINDRIGEFIKHQGLTKNSFSVKIGVASSVIQNIVEGRRNNPSFEVLQKIILAFDNINVRWLILGEGEILASAHPSAHLNTHLNEPKEEYKSKKVLELEQENLILKAQIEALYRAFREFGTSIRENDKGASKTA